ncbi:hypothetical protein GGX14DRAFT_387978 [Mycena pura]|uniref:Uncharacterized protein n=1 Tax=Mycena pura TaxID=153505 RepID=A0AAD6VVS5_9AGAR|nr:hypothetical protein GGX14DRAFT_387978 [Mycena pura]
MMKIALIAFTVHGAPSAAHYMSTSGFQPADSDARHGAHYTECRTSPAPRKAWRGDCNALRPALPPPATPHRCCPALLHALASVRRLGFDPPAPAPPYNAPRASFGRPPLPPCNVRAHRARVRFRRPLPPPFCDAPAPPFDAPEPPPYNTPAPLPTRRAAPLPAQARGSVAGSLLTPAAAAALQRPAPPCERARAERLQLRNKDDGLWRRRRVEGVPQQRQRARVHCEVRRPLRAPRTVASSTQNSAHAAVSAQCASAANSCACACSSCSHASAYACCPCAAPPASAHAACLTTPALTACLAAPTLTAPAATPASAMSTRIARSARASACTVPPVRATHRGLLNAELRPRCCVGPVRRRRHLVRLRVQQLQPRVRMRMLSVRGARARSVALAVLDLVVQHHHKPCQQARTRRASPRPHSRRPPRPPKIRYITLDFLVQTMFKHKQIRQEYAAVFKIVPRYSSTRNYRCTGISMSFCRAKLRPLPQVLCLTGTFDKRNITSSSSYLRGPQMVTHDVGQALPARQRSPISDI